jgi:Zn-finger nucleic acid-binding protein
LTELVLGELRVDVCRGGCGGVWFDNFELQKADHPTDFAGVVLQEVERDERIQIDPSRRRYCPRCGDLVMMRHFFSQKRRVEVDTCPGCGGTWLDYGELAVIRRESLAEANQKRAVADYFSGARKRA